MQRQALLVHLGACCAGEAAVDNSYVLEVQRGAVVFVSANLGREFAGVVGVVEVPELVGRQGEAFVAEKAIVVVAELSEIAQEVCVTAGGVVVLILGRIALSAFGDSEGGIVLVVVLVLGAFKGRIVLVIDLGGRIALSAVIQCDGFTLSALINRDVRWIFLFCFVGENPNHKCHKCFNGPCT